MTMLYASGSLLIQNYVIAQIQIPVANRKIGYLRLLVKMAHLNFSITLIT